MSPRSGGAGTITTGLEVMVLRGPRVQDSPAWVTRI